MTPPPIALYFDPDAYTETHGRGGRGAGAPRGLMGRQVAGQGVPRRLPDPRPVGHADRRRPVARPGRAARAAVPATPVEPHRPRRLRIVAEAEFPAAFAGAEPAGPACSTSRARRTPGSPGPGTRRRPASPCAGSRTRCRRSAAVHALCDLVDRPVRAVRRPRSARRGRSPTWCGPSPGRTPTTWRDRFGGEPRLRPRLEIIPLGVDPDRFRPATADERAAERARLGAADDEVLVLCVGRLSHHAKAHPFPVFHAVERGGPTDRTEGVTSCSPGGRHTRPSRRRTATGPARFAPAARVAFVDGHDPADPVRRVARGGRVRCRCRTTSRRRSAWSSSRRWRAGCRSSARTGTATAT